MSNLKVKYISQYEKGYSQKCKKQPMVLFQHILLHQLDKWKFSTVFAVR